MPLGLANSWPAGAHPFVSRERQPLPWWTLIRFNCGYLHGQLLPHPRPRLPHLGQRRAHALVRGRAREAGEVRRHLSANSAWPRWSSKCCRVEGEPARVRLPLGRPGDARSGAAASSRRAWPVLLTQHGADERLVLVVGFHAVQVAVDARRASGVWAS